jgi:hypothetical protein
MQKWRESDFFASGGSFFEGTSKGFKLLMGIGLNFKVFIVFSIP